MSVTEAGFDVEADTETNTLYLELSGTLSTAQMKQAAAEALTSARHLSEGFGVINDISEFKPLSQDVADTIADGKEILAANGAEALVRVTGDSALGDMQFSRVGGEEGYDVTKVETVEEAEAKLSDR